MSSAMPIRREVILEETTCVACTIVFAVPADWLESRRISGDGFWCPNGHSLTYGSTRYDEMKRRAERAEANAVHARDQLLAAERSQAALKGVVTRTKKRVGNGVCPCCSRSFSDLGRHMKGKHPEYAEATDAS